MVRATGQYAPATAGVVYIHAAPAALCPHIEWALSSVLGRPAQLRWTAQPAAAGQLRATSDWCGPAGTAGRVAKALRFWSVLRFEVTEDPSAGVDGERYSFVPGLGLWHGSTGSNGDITISEMRLRDLLHTARAQRPSVGFDLVGEIDRALGTAWDEDLEAYRCGSEGAEITWLHSKVG